MWLGAIEGGHGLALHCQLEWDQDDRERGGWWGGRGGVSPNAAFTHSKVVKATQITKAVSNIADETLASAFVMHAVKAATRQGCVCLTTLRLKATIAHHSCRLANGNIHKLPLEYGQLPILNLLMLTNATVHIPSYQCECTQLGDCEWDKSALQD